MTSVARWIGTRFISTSLKRRYRSIEWLGEIRKPPDDVPLVVYANHHLFDDGYVMCHLIERVLQRPLCIWMEQFDRFPFFHLLGAMPFPKDDAARRSRTIRSTARQFARDPRTVLVYFPEGRLHSGRGGLGEFVPDVFERLDRVLPEKRWWPIALHIGGWHRARPTVLLNGGDLHARAHGYERDSLAELLDQCQRATEFMPRMTLLSGKPGPDERWDFSRFAKRRTA